MRMDKNIQMPNGLRKALFRAIRSPDKRAHFFTGLISLGILAPSLGLGWGILACSLVWLAKELIYDGLMGMGTVDALDFVASLLGILSGAIIILLVRWWRSYRSQSKKDIEIERR